MPTAEVRLEFRRGAGQGTPRAELCALLLADGAVRGPADLVVAEAPEHVSGAVTHTREGGADGSAVDTLLLDLASLESAVTAVLVVVRAEGGPAARIPAPRLSALGGGGPVRFELPGVTGGPATAVGECYREGGGWRLRALARTAPPLPSAARRPPAGAGRRAAGGTRLGPGLLRIAHSADGGAELGALFELADGRKGVVQALGGATGALWLPPYVQLDAGGGRAELTVNLDQAVRFRRVLVFLAVRGGSFADSGGTVEVRPEHGPPADFALPPSGGGSAVCALVLLTRERAGEGGGGGAVLRLRREARYLPARPGLSPQRTVDYAYGWALRWVPADA
ncbi:TerD family protein [Streptomyces sp. NRRL F-5123]|uniref:TerD family protein n=1 Tax=Streptomyces sp. NRRL F-5123 TaxID=1463856 RepID=UPI00131DA309|nr:TerD family protein [Streptomyces sp. NRRL F-5123]